MYHWIDDKQFLSTMRTECSDIVNRLKMKINNDGYLKVETQMVGSGARGLETQNANEHVDLDYNICIISIDGNKKENDIKEYIRKEFNKVLKNKGVGDCSDSTSALTTPLLQFKSGNKTKFSIDIAIVKEVNKIWYRMKHEKTGNTKTDKWYWNEGPSSKDLTDKAYWLRKNNHWPEVKEAYLCKKNQYLSRQDDDHPSFVCYIEAVNEIYGTYKNTNDHKKVKSQTKSKTIYASLNMNYCDDSHSTFYCSYIIDEQSEIKSPIYNNNTSEEDDFELVMRWLNKLTTSVAKDKSVTKLVISISPYISSMICDNKIGNRVMTKNEINRIRSYLGRIKKLGIDVTTKKVE